MVAIRKRQKVDFEKSAFGTVWFSYDDRCILPTDSPDEVLK